MSLLEDVFLQDEASEAQDLERIIEGDEFEERRSEEEDDDDGGPKEDEAEEDKRRIDPHSGAPKRVVKNPRFTLNPARLTGPRGIQVIPDHFKDFKFKGKGHEKEDLDMVLKTLEHWAYRLYPKLKFQDCLKKIETLGKKRPVMVHLHKIRSDQFLDEPVVQEDSSDEEEVAPADEFDIMLQQQIANSTIQTPASKQAIGNQQDFRSPMLMPKATSSPSISEEQKERMLRNKKLAEERRLARLAAVHAMDNVKRIEIDSIAETNEENDNVNTSKHRKSNVIESDSDEEMSITQDTTVDVHDVSKEKSFEEEISGMAEKNINSFEENEKVFNKMPTELNSQVIGEASKDTQTRLAVEADGGEVPDKTPEEKGNSRSEPEKAAIIESTEADDLNNIFDRLVQEHDANSAVLGSE